MDDLRILLLTMLEFDELMLIYRNTMYVKHCLPLPKEIILAVN